MIGRVSPCGQGGSGPAGGHNLCAVIERSVLLSESGTFEADSTHSSIQLMHRYTAERGFEMPILQSSLKFRLFIEPSKSTVMA